MPNLSLQDQTSEFLLYTAPNPLGFGIKLM